MEMELTINKASIKNFDELKRRDVILTGSRKDLFKKGHLDKTDSDEVVTIITSASIILRPDCNYHNNKTRKLITDSIDKDKLDLLNNKVNLIKIIG